MSLRTIMMRRMAAVAVLAALSLVPLADASAAGARSQGTTVSRGARGGSTATSKPPAGPPSGSCLSGGFATCGGFVGPGPWAGEHQPLTGSGAQAPGREQGTGR
jgi:hypothetical protein